MRDQVSQLYIVVNGGKIVRMVWTLIQDERRTIRSQESMDRQRRKTSKARKYTKNLKWQSRLTNSEKGQNNKIKETTRMTFIKRKG